MKKIKIIWLFLIFISISVTFTTNSCKDNPPCIVKCDSILEAHPDAFQYLIFPVGSWWEFELLDSGILDTLTLRHKNMQFTDNQCIDGNDICKYNYRVYYFHSNIDYAGKSQDKIGSREEFFLRTFEGKIWIVLHSSFAYNNSTMGHFLNFPFNLGQSFTNDRFVSDTAKILPVNGKNVKCLQISSKKSKNEHEHRIMNFYMAKGIGIVRFEYQNGHIWQLKSHFINK
jgi:hypothetical protein